MTSTYCCAVSKLSNIHMSCYKINKLFAMVYVTICNIVLLLKNFFFYYADHSALQIMPEWLSYRWAKAGITIIMPSRGTIRLPS